MISKMLGGRRVEGCSDYEHLSETCNLEDSTIRAYVKLGMEVGGHPVSFLRGWKGTDVFVCGFRVRWINFFAGVHFSLCVHLQFEDDNGAPQAPKPRAKIARKDVNETKPDKVSQSHKQGGCMWVSTRHVERVESCLPRSCLTTNRCIACIMRRLPEGQNSFWAEKSQKIHPKVHP